MTKTHRGIFLAVGFVVFVAAVVAGFPPRQAAADYHGGSAPTGFHNPTCAPTKTGSHTMTWSSSCLQISIDDRAHITVSLPQDTSTRIADSLPQTYGMFEGTWVLGNRDYVIEYCLSGFSCTGPAVIGDSNSVTLLSTGELSPSATKALFDQHYVMSIGGLSNNKGHTSYKQLFGQNVCSGHHADNTIDFTVNGWMCGDNPTGSWTANHYADRITNLGQNLDQNSLSNFNILYRANSDATILTSVFNGAEVNQGKDLTPYQQNLVWCASINRYVQTTGTATCQNTATAGYADGVTPASFLGTGTANITLKDKTGKTLSTVAVAKSQNAPPTPPAGVCADGSTDPSCASGSQGKTCEDSGGPLSWLFCQAIDAINSAEVHIESGITSLLKTRPFVFGADGKCTTQDVNCSNQQLSATIYGVWSNFRVYGDVVLVIALLVIVFGESLGGGMIDAYTAKKVLPRILIAAILINLSIYIVAILEDIINVIGSGLANLMVEPFKALAVPACGDPAGTTAQTANATCNVMSTVKISGGTGLLLGGAVGVIMGVAWIAGFGAFMLIVVLPLLLAAIGVLITLAIRQGLLVVLLMVSPIAFALYVLPNTEQYFKKWWGLLVKTLMVYPIVMAVFAVSYISGVVMSHFGIQPNILAQSISVLAALAPLFLIPFAFKMAGGVIGNIQSMMSSMAAKASKPMRKKGLQRAAGRLDRAQKQSLYSNSSKLGRFGNKLATWTTAPGSNALYYAAQNKRLRRVPGIGPAGQRVASQLHHARMEQTANLFKEFNDIDGFNDRAYRLMSGAHWGMSDAVQADLKRKNLYGRAPRSATELESMIETLQEHGGATEKIAADALEGGKNRIASLFLDPEMSKANWQAAGIMGLSAHGFATGEDLEGVGNMLEDSAGSEFALATISRAQLLGTQSRPDIKAGYGVVRQKDENGKMRFVNGISPEGGRAESLLTTLKSADFANAKGGAFEALAPTIKEAIDSGGHRAQAAEDSLFQLAGPYSQASMDIKKRALDFIYDPANNKTVTKSRQVEVKDANGNIMVGADGRTPITRTEQYTTWADDSIAAKFEQAKRVGRSVEEIEAMRAAGMNPDQPPPGAGEGQ